MLFIACIFDASMSSLIFAVIGCGQIAPRHIENILKYGRLAAVCDSIPEKADLLAGRFASKAWYDYDELLKEETSVNVIVICTPNGLHAEHAIKALQSGRHVICEKPMCISLPAAWSMRDTAHFFRKHLFVVKQNRFNPPVQAVKKLLEEKKLGKITSVQVNGFWNREERYYANSWKGSRELDGGILYTQFSHFIDLFYWFFGEIDNVRAIRKNSLLNAVTETEDNVVAIAETREGALCSFHFSVNAYEKNREGSMTIIGEKGLVKIGGQYLNTLEYQQVKDVSTAAEDLSLQPANDYGFYQGSMSNHDKVYENIAAVLSGKKSSYTNAEDGLKTIEIIEKIYKACLS